MNDNSSNKDHQREEVENITYPSCFLRSKSRFRLAIRTQQFELRGSAGWHYILGRHRYQTGTFEMRGD